MPSFLFAAETVWGTAALIILGVVGIWVGDRILAIRGKNKD